MRLDVSLVGGHHPVDAIVLALRSLGAALEALETDSNHVYVKVRVIHDAAFDVVSRALLAIDGVATVVRVDAFPGEVQRHLLGSILADSADPQLGADLQGRVTVANEAAQALFSMPVIGAQLHELFGDRRLQKVLVVGHFAASTHDVKVCGMPYLLKARQVRAAVDGAPVVGGLLNLLPPAVGLPAVNRSESEPFRAILGQCHQMNALRVLASKFAQSEAPLMVRGETGTGKELVALASHKASPRRDATFLALNCAAMPESLAESELFGYASGSFSGANRGGKAGLLELAHRGTLFLDEIGEMSPYLQAKLLRFLQDGTFIRVGASQPTKVDVRIISATHRNLEEMVKRGMFREDLFYRLNVLDLTVPALRHREDDVLLLAEHFLAQACEQHRRPRCRFSAGAVASLRSYAWPGNVRQLRNIIVRAVAATDGEVIARSGLFAADPPMTAAHAAVPLHIGEWGSLSEAVAKFERDIFEKLYQEFPSSRLLATRLKVSHTTVATKLRKHGIGGGVSRSTSHKAASDDQAALTH